ncbi:MAG TPA: tail fiber domain-containing protein [Kiritimatiellia bacterium]|nr:tail fiber domain-containing protein [Kiritimatiellia bacterium]HMO99468.1 tail fiber domain-containing protein [Kiritimatiellia bacterium]
MNKRHALWIAGTVAFATLAQAQAPNLIHYQGRLVDGTNLVNGPVSLTFQIHSHPTLNDLLFQSTNTVIAVDGLYATLIGQHVTTGSLDSALTAPEAWLQVIVNDTPLTPRERLVSVPYARQVHGLAINNRQSVTLAPVQGTNTMWAEARASVIGGGNDQTIEDAWYSVIAGGRLNRITLFSDFGVIGGGFANILSNQVNHAVIGGGSNNVVASGQSVIAGGEGNRIRAVAPFSAIGGGRINRILGGGNRSVIGGGENNEIGASYGVVGGGSANRIETNAFFSTVGGGILNAVMTNSAYATVGGGIGNQAGPNAGSGVIGGGSFNRLDFAATNSFIGGGANNTISNANSAAIGGGSAHVIAQGAHHSVIGGGQTHTIQPGSTHGVIAGGANHQIGSMSTYAFIGGGLINQIGADATNAVIVGGRMNVNAGSESTIAGGFNNLIQQENLLYPIFPRGPKRSFIGGGYNNTISSNHNVGVIGGGHNNHLTNSTPSEVEAYGVIGGGAGNIVGGYAATVPGGSGNRAMANFSLAAGVSARVRPQDGRSFVFSGSLGRDSVTNSSITMDFPNGYYFFTSDNNGAQIPPNGTSWSAISDREAKENFAPVDTGAILGKVAAMPLTEWNYKEDPNQRRYIGPVAQDFHAAFGLGDDKTINTLDADGVLFAAVQALAVQREADQALAHETRERMTQLEEENARLRERLEALERKLGL